MKKLIVVLSILGLSQALSSQDKPINGALYAEIRGLSGGWLRIYKGAEYKSHLAKNTASKLWSPKVYFFDEKGKKIAQEELKDGHLLEHSDTFTWENYHKAINGIRSRLTELPIVHKAEVVSVKAPCYQSVELFDKNGTLIARTKLGYWGCPKQGDLIPDSAQDLLKKLVRNPEDLKSMSISKSYASF